MSNIKKVESYLNKLIGFEGNINDASSTEVAAAMVFSIFDKDKDGTILKDEYKSISKEQYNEALDKQMAAFQKAGLKLEDNMILSYEEMGQLLPDANSFVTAWKYVNKSIVAKEIIADLDKNKDNLLTYNEIFEHCYETASRLRGHVNSLKTYNQKWASDEESREIIKSNNEDIKKAQLEEQYYLDLGASALYEEGQKMLETPNCKRDKNGLVVSSSYSDWLIQSFEI